MPRDLLGDILSAHAVFHHAVRQRAVKVAGGEEISAHQATILAQLHGNDASTLTDLAQAMGVTLPTMSLLVDRLVGAGLVRRERDPADGRRVALRLTDLGTRAARARSILDPERVRSLLASLTPAERAAGVAGMNVLARAAQRLGGSASPDKPSLRGRS